MSLMVWDANMKHTNTRALFEYWNKLRGEENAPQRAAIDPSDIKWMLPGMFILEYRGEGKFPFSLAGTHLCDHYDRELRGQNICDLWTGQDRTSFVHVLQSVIEESAVGIVGFSAHTNLRGSCNMEMLVMPVKSPPRRPPRVLGCMAAFDKPVWQGNDNEKISHQDISSLRMMWPDREGVEAFTVIPEFYTERLEKIDGNQFTAVKHLRVIEGGRREF
jgi:hypothetical protein